MKDVASALRRGGVGPNTDVVTEMLEFSTKNQSQIGTKGRGRDQRRSPNFVRKSFMDGPLRGSSEIV